MKIRKILMVLFVLFLGNTKLLYSVVPQANTDIGNQAILKYTDASGTDNELTSNIVITRVQQIYKVLITPNRVETVLGGQTATFSHTVTNEGNGTDTINLAHSYQGDYIVKIYLGSGENQTEITSLENMALGESKAILVVVETPIGLSGSVNHNIIATSLGDSNETSVAIETINYSTYASVIGEKSIDISSGDSTIDRVITVSIKLYNSSETNSGEVIVEDILNNRFKYVSGSGKWYPHGGGSYEGLTDATGGDTAGLDYFISNEVTTTEGGFNNETKEKINFTISSIPGNTTNLTSGGYLEFQVKVLAGTSTGTINNSGNFSFNNGVQVIENQETNNVTYSVLAFVNLIFTGDIIDQASAGERIYFVNELKNTGNVDETYNVVLSGGTFPADVLSTAKLIKLITTEDEIISDPNTNEIIQILGSSETTDMIDTNSDGIIDTGSIPAGSIAQILLQLDLSSDIVAGVYTINKTGTSIIDSSKTITVEDKLLTVSEPTVDLTNNFSLSVDPQAPGVGQGPETTPVTTLSTTGIQENTVDRTVIYTLYVNNISSFVTENYDLDTSGDEYFSAPVLSTITIVFTDESGVILTNTGDIAPGNFKKIFMKVTPNRYTLARDVDIYVRVKSSTTGAKDIKHERLTITPYREIVLTLTPETDIVIPGQKVGYYLNIANIGNISEAGGNLSPLYFQKTESQVGWASEVYWDANGNNTYDSSDGLISVPFASVINPNESEDRFLAVEAPLSAQKDDVNTTILTGTSPDKDGVALIINIVQVSTTVITEDLAVEKFQSLDGIVYTKDLQSAEPGDEIYYKIVITNTGDASATDVFIEDDIPQYTTLENISGNNTPQNKGIPSYAKIDANGNGADNYNLVQTMPSIGSGGLIRAEIGELLPNESAVMYFHVKIDS